MLTILARTTLASLAALSVLACSSNTTDPEAAPERGVPAVVKHDFEQAPVGALPPGFRQEVGEWRIVEIPGGGRALAQLAENERTVFNVALADEPKLRDLALRVRVRAEAGEIDQGGGPVWRARDARNYFICRYNPLEENFRVYKVIDGKREQLASADAPDVEGWHEIEVTCVGEEIRCSLDGALLLQVSDAALAEAGRVGLWTKADAVTWFDDLVVEQR